MENMEMNNVTTEVMENVAEVASIDWKKVGIVGGSVMAAGALIAVGLKKGVPFVKEKIEKHKAKKLEKNLKAAGEIDKIEK